jgi:hypothetical protein
MYGKLRTKRKLFKTKGKKSTHTTVKNEQAIINEFSFETQTYNCTDLTHTHTYTHKGV